MKKPSLVTVITLTYKNFDNLFDTIKSVLEQDYSDMEYVISDDGSENFPKEKIIDFIEKNKKPNLVEYKIICNEKNLGTVKNINGAYKASNGKYLINLSCNDIFFKADSVSKIVARFEEKKCDVMVTSRIAYNDELENLFLLPHYKERKIIEKWDTGYKQYCAFITENYYDMASGSAMYFSKEIMEKMNYFDEKYRLWEDGPFIAKYTQIGKIETAYDIISIKYQMGGVSTGKSINSILYEDACLFEREEQYANKDKLDKKTKRRISYQLELINSKNKKEKLITKVRFFDQWVNNVLYFLRRKIFEKYDKRIINNL